MASSQWHLDLKSNMLLNRYITASSLENGMRTYSKTVWCVCVCVGGGGGGDLNAPLIEWGDREKPVLLRGFLGKKEDLLISPPFPPPPPTSDK